MKNMTFSNNVRKIMRNRRYETDNPPALGRVAQINTNDMLMRIEAMPWRLRKGNIHPDALRKQQNIH